MVIAADMSAPLMRDIVVLAVSKSAGIVFQGGQNGGLVKVKELTEKLNAIEKEINDLKTALSPEKVKVDPQGGVLATVFKSWAGQTLTQTKQTDLENANFKH
jgi:tetrahydromethanopterin S-methyltransferase subunit B